MTPQLLEKLLEYIDAKILLSEASRFEDGGLAESVNVMNLKNELFNLI